MLTFPFVYYSSMLPIVTQADIKLSTNSPKSLMSLLGRLNLDRSIAIQSALTMLRSRHVIVSSMLLGSLKWSHRSARGCFCVKIRPFAFQVVECAADSKQLDEESSNAHRFQKTRIIRRASYVLRPTYGTLDIQTVSAKQVLRGSQDLTSRTFLTPATWSVLSEIRR